MRIPDAEKACDTKVLDIIGQCTESIRDRRLRYERRRRWLLFGNDSEQPLKYNRLLSHTDLVSSFLFSLDAMRFSLTPSGSKLPVDNEIMDASTSQVRGYSAAAITTAIVTATHRLMMGMSMMMNPAFSRRRTATSCWNATTVTGNDAGGVPDLPRSVLVVRSQMSDL